VQFAGVGVGDLEGESDGVVAVSYAVCFDFVISLY
jgi:hypothetical protein